ncbi:3-deoxy-D-manno-octulosonic acid transferase [Candidatus Calescamantes bacterium]|nr:3-deoxy-D-manno-octulosonic acid transferase [Candidatus Calescamantes bacterium]
MVVLYNLFLLLFSFISFPFILYKLLRRPGVKERLGFLPPLPNRAIWVHAVSVGEVGASEPLIREMKQKYPSKPIVLSTTTETGRKVAEKSLKKWVERMFYFPLDYPWIIFKVFCGWRPSLIILMETEIWPNLITFSHFLGIPVILANGRLSYPAYRRYRMGKVLLKTFLKKITLFLVQTEKDKRLFLSLGAEPQKIKVVGNTKFDRLIKGEIKEIPLPPDSSYPVICAGSTHPGEEEIVLHAFSKVKKEFPSARLILVPRHPERKKEVEELLKKEDVDYILRSEVKEKLWESDVLLVDTVGELYSFYSTAHLAILGGTFVPVGGHNPLEPLSLKVPVFYGPYIFNFEEIFSIIEGKGAIKVAKENLSETLLSWIRDKRRLEEEGRKGYALLEEYKGAVKKHLEEIEKICAGLLAG